MNCKPVRTAILLLFSAQISAGLFAQATQNRGAGSPLINTKPPYTSKGWYLTPGLTYTAGIDQSERITNDTDTILVIDQNAIGRPGAFLQLGRFHVLDNRWFQLFDYGLDVRWIRGAHERTAEQRITQLDVADWPENTGTGSFGDLWLGLSAGVSHLGRLGNNMFISHTFGTNLNYAVVRDLRFQGAYQVTSDFQHPAFSAQLHYKLGVGFGVGRGWYIVPTIETPALGVYAWNGGIPSLRFFDTYYQPLLFGLRIMRLDKLKNKPCPTDEPAPGKKGKQNGLWDSKMNKKYGW